MPRVHRQKIHYEHPCYKKGVIRLYIVYMAWNEGLVCQWRVSNHVDVTSCDSVWLDAPKAANQYRTMLRAIWMSVNADLGVRGKGIGSVVMISEVITDVSLNTRGLSVRMEIKNVKWRKEEENDVTCTKMNLDLGDSSRSVTPEHLSSIIWIYNIIIIRIIQWQLL